jgi:hypothetical protein
VTLQELGELGNFLGGVLGVVALVYLAFQVRQNTVALRMNAYQESVRSANDAAALFATHPELTRLLIQARVDPAALGEEAEERFTQLLLMSLRNFALNVELARKNLLPASIPAAWEEGLRPFLDTPYGRDWWKRHASSLDADFRAHLEARFAALAREAAPRA